MWINVWVVKWRRWGEIYGNKDTRKSLGLQNGGDVFDSYDKKLGRQERKRLSFFALDAAGILVRDGIEKCASSFGYSLAI